MVQYNNKYWPGVVVAAGGGAAADDGDVMFSYSLFIHYIGDARESHQPRYVEFFLIGID